MKKLLITASLFWPQKNSGGPPISIMNLVQSVKDYFDIYIISNNHEIGETSPLPEVKSGWNEFDFGKVYYIDSGLHTSKNVLSIIEEVQPDVIYQNSFFSVNDLLAVLLYKKKHKSVKVVVAPRGEFYPERIKCGAAKKKIYGLVFRMSGLLRDVYFQGTGEDECRQEHEFLKIPESHLLNIQNLSVVSVKDVPEICKTQGELKLVYIARIHPTKNTLSAIEWLGEVKGSVTYDIYGSTEDTDYWDKCKESIAKLPENIKVNYGGMVDHDDVAEVISKYHAYYMPTTGENFGHSIVEAMLVGRPVVISDQTPWTDTNGIGGYALPLSDKDSFVKALDELCDMDAEGYAKLCDCAKEYINKKLNVKEIIEEYVKAFNS